MPSLCRPTRCAKNTRGHGCRAADGTIKGRLEQLGLFVIGSTPAELGQFLKSEMDKWGPVIKDAGISIRE